MIMSFSYVIDIGDRLFVSVAAQIHEFTDRLVRFNPPLRGLRVEHQVGGTAQAPVNQMKIILRVAGLTRWDIQRDAPKILGIILRKLGIPTESAKFDSMIMEPGRSHLKDGQGRTEMTRRPRAERMADGRPWDHIAWESDDVSASSPPDGSA